MSVKRSFPVEGVLATVLLSVSLCMAQTVSTNSSGKTTQVTNDLSVTVGKSVLVDTLQPIIRVSVGPGGFAVAQGITPTEVMINGTKEGRPASSSGK